MRPRRRPILASGEAKRRKHHPDYWLLVISIVLMMIGLIVVYAISPGLSVQKHVTENYYVSKQLIAIALGVFTFIVVSNMSIQTWRHIERPLIVTAGIASLAVRVIGERVNGAYRWIQVGGISFQAAELIKFALLIWIAGFLSDRIRTGEINDYQKSSKPLIIALVLVAIVVGKVQSDLGSTGVIIAIMGTMIYVAGLPLKKLAVIAGVVGVAVVVLVLGSGYRRERLNTYLNPNQDCLTTGYQACQALISVGSGGMFGLGLGRSVQAYGYLPEAANDSIFAIFAEKFGFVGTTVLIALFVAFFSRLKKIIEHSTDTYSRFLVTGILAWLSTQTIINIGAMIGLLPLKGITLPFISSGGTSIIFVSAAIGIAFQVSRYTTYGLITNNDSEGNRNDDSFSRRRLRGAYHPNSGSR
ncbi:MAG: putative peptidoglycan glycosyltransferase FtsW [Candidatus Saccharibacteria bacterium]|nr:putative peptidoglycan glycosyltransferase FtsW [Candidatus Saccharibacteria bacterium]